MTRRPTPIVHSLVRVWRDMDYAQRRLFEIRTGAPAPGPSKRR